MYKITLVLVLQIAAINCLNSIAIDSCGGETRNCTTGGPLCKNCTTLITCIGQEGQFEEAFNQDCTKTNQWCSTKLPTHSCTSDPNPICDGTACLDFICTGDGIFPDQFDSTKYHICIVINDKITHKEKVCDDGFRYNVKTTFCQKKSDEDSEEYPVDLCEEPAQTGPLDENHSYYYICENYPGKTVLYPTLYLCPNGEAYDNFKCDYIVP